MSRVGIKSSFYMLWRRGKCVMCASEMSAAILAVTLCLGGCVVQPMLGVQRARLAGAAVELDVEAATMVQWWEAGGDPVKNRRAYVVRFDLTDEEGPVRPATRAWPAAFISFLNSAPTKEGFRVAGPGFRQNDPDWLVEQYHWDLAADRRKTVRTWRWKAHSGTTPPPCAPSYDGRYLVLSEMGQVRVLDAEAGGVDTATSSEASRRVVEGWPLVEQLWRDTVRGDTAVFTSGLRYLIAGPTVADPNRLAAVDFVTGKTVTFPDPQHAGRWEFLAFAKEAPDGQLQLVYAQVLPAAGTLRCSTRTPAGDVLSEVTFRIPGKQTDNPQFLLDVTLDPSEGRVLFYDPKRLGEGNDTLRIAVGDLASGQLRSYTLDLKRLFHRQGATFSPTGRG
jgi:hypothetical protein